jgi:hypothetical protein
MMPYLIVKSTRLFYALSGLSACGGRRVESLRQPADLTGFRMPDVRPPADIVIPLAQPR